MAFLSSMFPSDSFLDRDWEVPLLLDERPRTEVEQVSNEEVDTNVLFFKSYLLTLFLSPKFKYIFEDFLGTEFASYVKPRWAIVFGCEVDYEVHELVNDELPLHLDTYEPWEGVDDEPCLGIDDLLDRDASPIERDDVLSCLEDESDGITNLVLPNQTGIDDDVDSDTSLKVFGGTEDLEDVKPTLKSSDLVLRTINDVDTVIPVVEKFDTNRLHLVKEVMVDGFESLLIAHERILSRNDWASLAMYCPDMEIPTCGDLLEIPVKHTDIEFIQMAVDELLPGVCDLNDSFFQELVETGDIALELDKAKIDRSVFNDWSKSKKCISSRLNTGNISKRVPTFREAALAIKKRNLNVPDLQQVFFEDEEARRIANRFINTVLDPNKLAQFPGYISEGEIGYYNKYLTGKAIDPDMFVDPCALVSMDKYRHMIKTTLKPMEDCSGLFERPLPATITYHDKGKVMSTSPIFLMMANRLMLCLNDKISIPSGKYHQLFSVDPFAFETTKEFKEIDFSKFDKSQQRLHHLIQFHIFTALGASSEFLQMWFGSHELSHISDGPCGIGFSVNYQRRTGDACTYLGNTIITLSALAYMYDLLDPNVTFVIASGDDSLIGSIKPLNREDEYKFTTLFNFEAKFPHNMPFVCSKFLILAPTNDGGKKVVAVPNALKLFIKLGVKDLSPYVFNEWYSSWLDLIWYFDNYHVVSTMRDYLSHRYKRGTTFYQEGGMLALRSVFSSKTKCLKVLFGLEPKDIEEPKPKKVSFNQIERLNFREKENKVPNKDRSKRPNKSSRMNSDLK
nr:RdRp [Blueberry shock virus]